MKSGIGKIILTFLFIVVFAAVGMAQKYFTRDANISFYSDAPLEEIEAKTSTGTSVFDASNGRMEFAVLIKAFQFKKALMQEHFNENYMESHKYPKALFKGQINNLDEIDLSTDGTYTVQVSGDLTIHGVTNPVQTSGEMTVKDGNVSADSKFMVKVADYNIEIPSVVRENIAREIEITVTADYQKLKK